jgi:hypothetical protein
LKLLNGNLPKSLNLGSEPILYIKHSLLQQPLM